jgi:hypothetical protein
MEHQNENEREAARLSGSRFSGYQGRRLVEKEDALEINFAWEDYGNGDIVYDTAGDGAADDGDFSGMVFCITRVKDGYLSNRLDEDGNLLPAVEASDGHTEWWEDGRFIRCAEAGLEELLEDGGPF